MKKFEKTLATAGGNEILAVIEGLPVSANGFFLTEAQMDSIDAALVAAEANATAAATLATVQQQLATANTAKGKAESDLGTANARIAELEKQDATIPSAAHADKEKKDATAAVDANTMDFQKELYDKL